MTFTSVAQADSKTAEFARLFDLFDRVATRRTRALTANTSEVISADDIANVPAEFAPLLKNLSTILSSRARRDEEHTQRAEAAPTTKPRHNTPAGTPCTTRAIKNPTPRVHAVKPSDQVKEDTDHPTFPLGIERYPFTFKLMLHKLYDLEEWAEKVKDAVETSRSQFKPLAERVQNVVEDATESIKERGERKGSVRPVLGASAKFRPPNTTRQRHSAVMSRDATASTKEKVERRSRICPVLGTSARFKPPMTRHLRSIAMPLTKPEASHALKKRCVGRRKSISGPTATGVWVYDAAISATEVAGPRPAVEITLSAPRGADSAVESRVRHRSLTALEEIRTRDTARRKVKITVPLLREEDVESVLPQPLAILQEVAATESVKRRRSTTSVFASASCRRAAVKRPLCV